MSHQGVLNSIPGTCKQMSQPSELGSWDLLTDFNNEVLWVENYGLLFWIFMIFSSLTFQLLQE